MDTFFFEDSSGDADNFHIGDADNFQTWTRGL